MNFEIIVTSDFERELKRLRKKYRSLGSDFADFLESLQRNPAQGLLFSDNILNASFIYSEIDQNCRLEQIV
jgi:mRNA-degrading endonuclease RelE of RelBE toxin-antitoxin system